MIANFRAFLQRHTWAKWSMAVLILLAIPIWAPIYLVVIILDLVVIILAMLFAGALDAVDGFIEGRVHPIRRRMRRPGGMSK